MQVLDESEVTVHFCKNVFWSSMQHLHLTKRFNWAMFSKSFKCENIEFVKTGLHFTKSCFWKKKNYSLHQLFEVFLISVGKEPHNNNRTKTQGENCQCKLKFPEKNVSLALFVGKWLNIKKFFTNNIRLLFKVCWITITQTLPSWCWCCL